MSKIQDIYNNAKDARDLIIQQRHIIEQYRGLLYRILLPGVVSIDTNPIDKVPDSIEFRIVGYYAEMADLAGIISSPFENYQEKYEDLMK